MNTTVPQSTTIPQLLAFDGPTCLIIRAEFVPLGEQDRFQPAGFPELGHVIYDAPRADENGTPTEPMKVCIVDSAASMANHLETLCFANSAAGILHADLDGLPYVRCVTDRSYKSAYGQIVLDPQDPHDRVVVSTLTEGHRLASDYFLDAHQGIAFFREVLRDKFGIVEIKKDKTYFITPENWWKIYQTIFRYDPNSLVHGVLFAREQIKISRSLTAHLEAFGAARVGSSGVKFDRLGKTLSGQPIFSKDEETARRIQATFLVDLGLIRSYGHGEDGLKDAQKRLLLELALWKIERMLGAPFRFRSGCHLRCVNRSYTTNEAAVLEPEALGLNIVSAIQACSFNHPVTDLYYPANKLFNTQPSLQSSVTASGPEPAEDENEQQEV